MITNLNEQILNEGLFQTSNITYNVLSFFNLAIQHKVKNGLYAKRYFYGNDLNISSVEFNITQKGCGECNIKLNKIAIDFTIGDEINIYVNGVKKYKGFVTKINDVGDYIINVSGYVKRLQEAIYTAVWNSYTIKEMLEDVISDTLPEIYFSIAKIDIDDVDSYSFTYNYEKVDKIVDELLELEAGAVWGVDTNNFFYVKKNSETIKQYFFWNSKNIKNISIDKSNEIEVTEYAVFQKSSKGNESFKMLVTSSENEFLAGRKIQEKITAPEGLASADIYTWALGKLEKEQEKIKESIECDININVDINPFDYISIQTLPCLQINEIINYLDVENATFIKTDIGDFYNDYVFYKEIDNNNDLVIDMYLKNRFLGLKKIFLFIKTTNVCDITISVSLTSFGYSSGLYCEDDYSYNQSDDYIQKSFKVNSGNIWGCYEIDVDSSFSDIITNKVYVINYIRITSSMATTLYIDRIDFLHYFAKNYLTNVYEVKYNINKKNQFWKKVICNKYQTKLNSELQKIEKRLAKMEGVTK